jgi:hypothetical protein
MMEKEGRGSKVGGHLLALVLHVGDSDMGTFGHEESRLGLSLATGCPGDDRHLSV